MRNDVDNRPRLGYDASTIDEQVLIEEKYELLLDEEDSDEALDNLLSYLEEPEE